MFLVLKKTISLRHMFRLRNKQLSFNCVLLSGGLDKCLKDFFEKIFFLNLKMTKQLKNYPAYNDLKRWKSDL